MWRVPEESVPQNQRLVSRFSYALRTENSTRLCAVETFARGGGGGGAIGEKNCAWTHGTREVEQPRGNWRRLSPFGYAKKNKKGNNESPTSDSPTTKRCENRIQRVSLWRRRKRRRIEFVIYDYAVQLLVKTSFRKNGGYFDFLFFHNA